MPKKQIDLSKEQVFYLYSFYLLAKVQFSDFYDMPVDLRRKLALFFVMGADVQCEDESEALYSLQDLLLEDEVDLNEDLYNQLEAAAQDICPQAVSEANTIQKESGSDGVVRLLATGTEAEHFAFSKEVLGFANYIETRGQTAFMTCMEESFPQILMAAHQSEITLQRFKHVDANEEEVWETIEGGSDEGRAWKPAS